jgi:hypothetical protein
MAGPLYPWRRLPFCNLAEVAGAFGHPIEHATDLLPARVEFRELRKRE